METADIVKHSSAEVQKLCRDASLQNQINIKLGEITSLVRLAWSTGFVSSGPTGIVELSYNKSWSCRDLTTQETIEDEYWCDVNDQ